jgi:2,4-dienoyl-CoA reductase (NADPH2)
MQLLEPIRLGSRTARNRIVFGPHDTNLGRGRSISDRHVAYYRRRAAGGAGVIVVEEASVHPSDWPLERTPLATECGPGWAAVVDACHAEGALVIAALGHAGGQGSSAYSQAPLWAPSRVPEVNTREVPKWMEGGDIAAVIAGFGEAAGLAIAAGCDGVEVNAGQFSLVRQFLSGLTNQRDDEWGADRLRFAREVLGAVRAAIGPDAVLSLRLSCDELAPWAGITPDMAVDIAVDLVADPAAIDVLTVVRGSIYSTAATRPDGHEAPGFNLDLTAAIRAAVHAVRDIPVVAQGSIVDVGQAEWAVGEGDRSDAVEMTRALLADADLVAKLAAGDADRIRPCILCNQTCQVRDVRNPIVTCVVDPRTGHELDDPAVNSATSSPGKVTVVGGGPAGMEAARVAASRGHQVRLIERRDRLGGAVPIAAAGAGRDRLSAITDWLAAECAVLGVTIELGAEVTVDLLGTMADRVIVATGSQKGERSYDVERGAVVVTASEVLDGAPLPDGPVLVWDPIGGPIGVSVAELLAAAGRTVHLATPDNIVGNELSRSGDLAPVNARLQQAGVELHRRSLLRSVSESAVELEDRFSGQGRRLEVVAVIDGGHRLPDDSLDGGSPEVVRAGDCVAPRTILEAILEGRRAALALDGIGTVSDGVPMGPSHH